MKKDVVLKNQSTLEELARNEIEKLRSSQCCRHIICFFGTFETETHIVVAMEYAPCDFFQLMTDNFGSYR